MKNGFTLIELLAIIIVIAIIALITTPVVIQIISESSKNTFKSKMSKAKKHLYIFNREISGRYDK